MEEGGVFVSAIVCLRLVWGCFGTSRCEHPELSGNGLVMKKKSFNILGQK
jgi:hypothetical protein